MSPAEREGLVSFFERRIPFNAWLGMRVIAVDDGTCTLHVPFRDDFVGDTFRPALHGGLVSTIGDAAGGLAVFARWAALETRVSTVDMRVDFLRPGRLEDIYCDAQVLRAGNRVAVTSMVVRHADGYVAAECRGVYNVVRPD